MAGRRSGGCARRVLGLALCALWLISWAVPGAGAATPLSRAGVPWAWGRNLSGQLGLGTTEDRRVPVPVPGLAHVVAVAAGAVHSLALAADGTVWAWGNDDFGQLGLGTTRERDRPARVPGLHGIVAVAAGTFHSLALAADGTVWSWGMNDAGQLGTGTACLPPTSQACISTVPVRIHGLRSVTAIAGGASWSLALTRGGTVWAWGLNTSGQLGTGTACAPQTGADCQSLVPVPVAGLGHVVAIAAGAAHGLAVSADGRVWAWGENGSGQVGRDPLTPSDCATVPCSARPQRVPRLRGIVAVVGGDRHSMALDAGGRVWTWGANGFGQLGVGTTADSFAPVQAAITGVVAVAGGHQCSLALSARGTVWAWGRDLAGTLAHTAYEGNTAPEQVPGLSHVLALAQGSYASHTLVIAALPARPPARAGHVRAALAPPSCWRSSLPTHGGASGRPRVRRPPAWWRRP